MLLWLSLAFADEPVLAATTEAGPWSVDHRIGFGAGLQASSGVIGAQNGLSVSASFDGWVQVTGRFGAHEWTTAGGLSLAMAKAPGLRPVAKTADLLDLETLYAYNALPWLAPMVRARATLNLLPSDLVVASDTEVHTPDGSSIALAQSRVPLSGVAEPVVLTEVAGVRLRPLDRETLRIQVDLGPGGQHIFARGGLVPDPTDTRTGLALRAMSTVHQVGAYAGLGIDAQFQQLVDWQVWGSVFLPMLAASPDASVRGLSRTTTEAGMRLGVRLGPVLRLSYGLSLRHVPLVADIWQVRNSVQLSTGCACGR